MEVISLGQNYSEPIVLCLGFFDCMHLGHVKLLKRAKQMAQSAKVALFTFCNSHFETLKRSTKLIYTFDERLALYRSLGVDVTLNAKFDADFMSLSGKEFLSEISRYNLSGVVCGADFTCGSDLLNATSVKEYLKDVCPVEIVDLVKQDGQKVCSSLVRRLLCEGNVQQANAYLSQPFFFLGNVQHGRRMGHNLGFPTVNVDAPEEKLAPIGVYGGVVTVDEKEYRAIVNVGSTPTFGIEKLTVEAHLIDFEGDLYGKRIKIALTEFLRPVQKFQSANALREQLQKDVEVVKND